MKKLIDFCKKDIVLVISFLLAAASCVVVVPDGAYIDYIDYRTLSILLVLMLVMAGLRELGFFSMIGKKLLQRTKNVRSLTFVLVLLCFVSGMLITNDVALITFVPFAVEVLGMAGLSSQLIRVIVLQTIAANLGSMLTPIGNPQNLYLYSFSGMKLSEFLSLMFPYTVLALGLLVICMFFSTDASKEIKAHQSEETMGSWKKAAVYLVLFGLAIASVMHLIPYPVLLGIAVLLVLVMDAKILKKADYALLFTFVFLFVFIGNIQRIPQISNWLFSIVHGNERVVSVVLSQIISNVPAAILLSGFTENIKELIIGVNIGGLGTIIASMASLISFKYYSGVKDANKGKYMMEFTVLNLIFLLVYGIVSLIF